MFLVDPKNVDKVLHICKQWDVNAIPIGHVIEDQITRVYYHKKKILEMDMDFLTGGPVYDSCQRPYQYPEKNNKQTKVPILSTTNIKNVLCPNISIYMTSMAYDIFLGIIRRNHELFKLFIIYMKKPY